MANRAADLLGEAKEVNESLERVRSNLTWSVQQTESVSELLKVDGKNISSALHNHKYELKQALQSTKARLNRIKLAETYEQLALTVALCFFGLVITFIVLSRTGIFLLITQYIWNCNNISTHSEL